MGAEVTECQSFSLWQDINCYTGFSLYDKVKGQGGDLVSTLVTKPAMHVEHVISLVKMGCMQVIANNDNFQVENEEEWATA